MDQGWWRAPDRWRVAVFTRSRYVNNVAELVKKIRVIRGINGVCLAQDVIHREVNTDLIDMGISHPNTLSRRLDVGCVENH